MNKFKPGDRVRFIKFTENAIYFTDKGKGEYIIKLCDGQLCKVYDKGASGLTWNVYTRELELTTVSNWKSKITEMN